MKKSLSCILSDSTIQLSPEDYVVIAYQLLDIVEFCFAHGKVFKNLSVNDFFIRRTTKGYRVVLLNQNFYTKYIY